MFDILSTIIFIFIVIIILFIVGLFLSKYIPENKIYFPTKSDKLENIYDMDYARSLDIYNYEPEAAELYDRYMKKFQKKRDDELPWDQEAICNYGTLDDIDWNSVVFDANPKIIIY
jgi:hypothetical protein